MLVLKIAIYNNTIFVIEFAGRHSTIILPVLGHLQLVS
jgi:hypothetical protein